MRSFTNKGFTLLEMVAVLVLILVLAGLAIPTYQAVITEARENAAVLSAKAFRDSIDAYAATQEVAPDELVDTAAETTLDSELPSNASATWGTADVTVTLEFGSDDKSACITLASTVGGSSTVAEGACA
jgi:prepilin-type N-terminal cleavage/methylation domain-containing protein